MNATAGKIVDGALPLLAEDPALPMTEIARRLGVGRTTLYRAFPDREGLVEQVRIEGSRRIVRALALAGSMQGTGLEVLEACCERLFVLTSELSLLLSDNPVITEDDLAEAAAREGLQGRPDPISLAVTRGRQDGSIDPELPGGWIEALLWTTVLAGRQFADDAGSQYKALGLVLTTMRRSVGRPSHAVTPD